MTFLGGSEISFVISRDFSGPSRRLGARSRVSFILLFLILAGALALSLQAPSSVSASGPVAPPGPGVNQVNNAEYPYYSEGLNSMLSQLYTSSPCTSYSGISEAPSAPYNWWTDDQAKALSAFAYDYAAYTSQEQNLIGLIMHNDVGGYLASRCVNIQPSITADTPPYDMSARNNLYVFTGNPDVGVSNPKYLFTVADNENPTLALAYIEGATVQANGLGYQVDNALAQLVQDGGFDGGGSQTPPWSFTSTPAPLSTSYYLSPPDSYSFTGGETVSQTLSVDVATSFVANITFWLASSASPAPSIEFTALYAGGGSQNFMVNSPRSSAAPGRWVEEVIQGSQLTAGKTLTGVEFQVPGVANGVPAGVYLDNVAISAFVGSASFSMFMKGSTAVMQQLYTNANLSVTIDYELQPGADYLNVVTTVKDTGTGPESGTMYNAMNGLDTIGTGYAWLYFPGVGWVRPNQNQNSLSVNYEPTIGSAAGDWNQNWFAIGQHGVPDWIGSNAIFVEFNQSQMPSQILNTIYANSTYTGGGGFLHWVQMGFDYSLASGGSYSYSQKWVFVNAYDWTNMNVYSTFLDGNNLNLWNNTDIQQSYYYGEVAQDLAEFGVNTNDQQAIDLSIGVWNYYYREIQAESNGTYTSSLARFVNASYTLYSYSVSVGAANATYLDAITYAANLLTSSKYEATAATYAQPETYWLHQDSGIASINGVATSGKIFNSSSTMETGVVLSGSKVGVSWYQSPHDTQAFLLGQSFSLNGQFNATFYMNANEADYAYYQVSVGYVDSAGAYTQLGASPNYTIGLSAGSGASPWAPYTATITLSSATVPYGAALVVGLDVASKNGGTVYVLFDSTNGPSDVQIPFVFPAIWQHEFTIPNTGSAASYTLTPALYPEPATWYFHEDSGIASINGVATSGKIFNSSSTMETGVVLSGNTVSVSFFGSPAAANYYWLNGNVLVTFYMNANVALTATYAVTLNEIAPNGTTFKLAGGTGVNALLTAGSGSPPFLPFQYAIPVDVQIPKGWALSVLLSVSAPSGDTVYVLYDSTNGPSDVQIPFVSETATLRGSYLVSTQQPYFLDTTAMAGWALMVAYHATGTAAYLAAAEGALGTIHYSMTPPTGFAILSLGYAVGSGNRLWLYSNTTSVDTDFSTYKSLLVSLFAEERASGAPLNATLADIAISRMWSRTKWNGITLTQVDTSGPSGPHIEMNSETQPWGLLAWYDWNIWARTYQPYGQLLFINFTNTQSFLYSVSSSTSAVSTTYLTNGPPSATGSAFVTGYLGSSQISSVTLNAAEVGWFTDSFTDEFFVQVPQAGSFTDPTLVVYWASSTQATASSSTVATNPGSGSLTGTNYTAPFGSCAPGSLPPTPLRQLEAGCVVPAIINVYAGVLGVQWTLALLVAAIDGLLFYKTQNSWVPLFINIIFALGLAFLLPGQALVVLTIFLVLGLAGALYFGFTRRG